MNGDFKVKLTLLETCDATGLSTDYLLEIVAHGIVEPEGSSPEDWLFDPGMLGTVQRACRLASDLELDWSAAALVLDLIEEKERLQRENRRLRQQLARFLID